jgi:hypothetical protein
MSTPKRRKHKHTINRDVCFVNKGDDLLSAVPGLYHRAAPPKLFPATALH